MILFNVSTPPPAGTTSLYIHCYDEFNLEPANVLLLEGFTAVFAKPLM